MNSVRSNNICKLKHNRSTYRVSHIKLDRVNGSNYDLGDKSENLRRMNHVEKFNKANRNYFAENARFL